MIGTDITPIQPSWVPPNVKFELDDCNSEWTWPDNTFDFINMRMLFGIVEDWDLCMRQAYCTCKPGGYAETFVFDNHWKGENGTVKEDSAIAQWRRVWTAAGNKMGRPFDVISRDLDRKAMQAAGFVDVQVREYYVPLGPWHQEKAMAELGIWWKMALEADLDGTSNLQ